MAVSETKIDCSYPDSQFLIPGYYLHQNDQKKGGGGVLLFVSSNKILSKRVTFNRSYKTIEPLALEFGLKSRNVIILVIYILPKRLNWYIQTSTRGGIKSYCQQTGRAGLQYPRVIITGDLNRNRMVPSSPEGKLLLDLEVEQGLKCMITKPTWIEMRGSLVTKSFSLTIRNYLRTVGSMILRSVTTDFLWIPE